MFLGFILAIFAVFFTETGASIGKFEVENKKESLYTMGVFHLMWGTLFFFAYGLFVNNAFIFSYASLPTFVLRAVLEVFQTHITILAIVRADRSTYSFLRSMTAPLLLGADFLLGYSISQGQIIGIAIIAISLIILFMNHGINKKGFGFVLFSTINAVITISLYKYNITHFNSVAAEQGIIMFILVLYFYFMARTVAKENPFRFLRERVFLGQSLAFGAGSVLGSFAYLFAPASIINTLERSLSVLASIISGKKYFHEKHFLIKLAVFALIATGLIFLMR
ncbi:hypothetical protein HYS99_01795 [Candidatus Giovannonibacteria bacterium]|nr:hypothetical protein [Candidatus Giovannonibacteria bacterium]